MLSKNKIKHITSLSQKKFRDELGLFVAEGTKIITDLASTFQCDMLVATKDWFNNHPTIEALEQIEVEENELLKISNQKSPQGVFAVFQKPTNNWNKEDIKTKLSLALDDIQDPGNLGTIVRIADWFGINDVFCSEFCADVYSPKTVQATMGALARVKIHSVKLSEFLDNIKSELPIYGTFMNGENIYTKTLTQQGIIVMGNEGNGITAEIEKLVVERLLIPNFPMGEATSESLNVGVATALVCSEFRRVLMPK
jgi:TrmH family RNA methyltransferase